MQKVKREANYYIKQINKGIVNITEKSRVVMI